MAISETAAARVSEKIVWNRFALAVFAAAGAAAAVNAVIYLIASALGAMPQSVMTPRGEPVTLVPVAGSSLGGVLGGAIVFMLLVWLTKRPISIFRIVASVFLVLSLYTPFSLSNAPPAMIITLELMHITVGLIVIYAFTTFARETAVPA